MFVGFLPPGGQKTFDAYLSLDDAVTGVWNQLNRMPIESVEMHSMYFNKTDFVPYR